jgi:ethanolamine utilization protein EutN
MKLCRVIGPVVSTVKHPTYVGTKLLAVQPIDPEGGSSEDSFLAVDRVQAGEGDIVLVMSEGNGVRQLYGIELLPIRSVIIAIVDAVDRPPYAGLEPGEPL